MINYNIPDAMGYITLTQMFNESVFVKIKNLLWPQLTNPNTSEIDKETAANLLTTIGRLAEQEKMDLSSLRLDLEAENNPYLMGLKVTLYGINHIENRNQPTTPARALTLN